jgi:hypothetical protein
MGDGALADIMSGKARYWSGYDGSAMIHFPDGREIVMASTYDLNGNPDTAAYTPGMLAWRRPNTRTICFEPIAGCLPGATPDQPMISNEMLSIVPVGALSMHTTINLR